MTCGITNPIDAGAADWPATIVGDRAAITAFDDRSIAADWLEEAAQAIAGRGEPCRIDDRLAEGDRGWWILGDGEPVGALCGRAGRLRREPGVRALVWTWLAIDARWRAYGYGGAAVPLLEAAAREIGASLALTPLPADNGVALYFWLRLGYTPIRAVDLAQPDWPSGVAADALWMQRPLVSTPEITT